MSFTPPQLRARIYSASSAYGFARTADKIVRDGIVDAGAFLDQSKVAFDGAGVFQFRPTLTGANRVKMGLTVEGSTWVHGAGPYTDALTALDYEAVGLIHPDDLNDCLRRAPRHIYLQYFWPVGPWLDNDFADSALTQWTAGQIGTVATKTTTGGVNTQAGQTGPRNLILTNSLAGGYTPSSVAYVEPGDQFFHGGIGRANAACTASYVLWDVDHAVALETVTFEARAFQRIGITTTIPEGCRRVQVRIGGVESNAVTEWDCLFGHIEESGELTMPSWLVERFQLHGFGPAEYGRNTDDRLSNASSRRIDSWYEHDDYEMFPLGEAASQRVLQVNHRGGLPGTEMWVHAQRPYSDFETLEDEDDLIDAPEDLLMASIWYEYFSTLHEAYKDASGNSEWLKLRDEKKDVLDAQRIARTPIQPRRVQYIAKIGARGYYTGAFFRGGRSW